MRSIRVCVLWVAGIGLLGGPGCADDSTPSDDTSHGTAAGGGGGGEGGATTGGGEGGAPTGGAGGEGGLTTGGAGGEGGSTTSGGSRCGDGVLEGTEECDDGNLTSGDGCDNDCSFTCVDTDECDDADPCNGMESCGSDHVCASTASLPDGTDCGGSSVCIAGNCVAGSCGDGLTSGTEECDDGNATNGDGCDSDCTFSCLSTNPANNCSSNDPCVGDGTCDDASHTCTPGNDVIDGLPCGVAQICLNGSCTPEQCGDGFPAAGEPCDFGAGNGPGTGCELDCTFSCTTSPNSCDDLEPCNGDEACALVTGPNGGSGQACSSGVPLLDGTSCGPGMFCMSAVCTTPNCGNGIIEGGELCDLGAGNGPGTGCEANCQFSCTLSPNSCLDANACNGAEVCTSTMVSGQTVQVCQAGANAPPCTPCAGGLCNAVGACAASTCGDGCVNASTGEQCDPPNGTTCSATCTLNPVCGNGALEAGEECDDGNLAKLDGCDSGCGYEMVTRMTSLTIQGTTAPAFCTPTTNRLGTQSLTATAINALNTPLQDGINQGTTNILTQTNSSTATEIDQVSGDAASETASNASDTAADDSDPRVIGDYVTFTFSGGYRKTPLRLTQRVVARGADRITVDYTFAEANLRDTLRATFSTAAAHRGDLLEVARVAPDGSTSPATSAQFDAKMAGTAAIADENEAMLDERQTTVRVGDSDITATRSLYKVRVGAKAATLETTTSAAFHWGDLGGKIVTADGKVYFQAELVDAGGPSSARASLE